MPDEIEAIAPQDVGCERLMNVPGIGPIVSRAMVVAIGAEDAFSKGRDFAAWPNLQEAFNSTIASASSAVVAPH